jgi:hypothetical protein
MMDDAQKRTILRVGAGVIILLLALTLAEYLIGSVVAIWWGALALMAIAIGKAYLVVRHYMHIGRLFAGDEESH